MQDDFLTPKEKLFVAVLAVVLTIAFFGVLNAFGALVLGL